MNTLVLPLVANPGPPVVALATDATSALVAAGIGLDLLLVLGAVLLLLGRDPSHRAAPTRVPRRAARVMDGLPVETALQLGPAV